MKLHEKVEQYFDKYKDYMEFYESKSTVAKTRGVTNEDLFALGTQLEQYDAFQEFSESNGGYGDLGVLPNIALDVITASTAQSPIPLIASIQPLQEQQGTIYFKNVVAETTRGGVIDNDKLVDPIHGRVKRPTSFAGEDINDEAVGTGDGSTTQFAGTVLNKPVRKREVEVKAVDANGNALKLIDDGQGNLIGVGGFGTIDYVTGDYTVEFLAANVPASGGIITIDYATNFEALNEIPTIRSEFDSIGVRARTYALRSDVGLFKSYSLGKRFGINVEETMAKDLTQELTTEVASNVVMEAYVNATGNTDWSKTAPSGISFTEHKLTFFDALSYAESMILSNAGRSGGATALVAGHQMSALIRTLPGFKPAGDLNAVLGTHFFGTLDGKPVLRSSVVPEAEMLMISKGTSMFDTSLVYAPYLPLFVTNMSDGIDHNPLKSQKGVALQAGMIAPVPTLITKITMVA
jgi:hypothetical protein